MAVSKTRQLAAYPLQPINLEDRRHKPRLCDAGGANQESSRSSYSLPLNETAIAVVSKPMFQVQNTQPEIQHVFL
jgi:hypothetical protein